MSFMDNFSPEAIDHLKAPYSDTEVSSLYTLLNAVCDLFTANPDLQRLIVSECGSGDSGGNADISIALLSESPAPKNSIDYKLIEYDLYQLVYDLADHYVPGYEMDDGGGFMLSFIRAKQGIFVSTSGYLYESVRHDQTGFNEA